MCSERTPVRSGQDMGAQRRPFIMWFRRDEFSPGKVVGYHDGIRGFFALGRNRRSARWTRGERQLVTGMAIVL